MATRDEIGTVSVWKVGEKERLHFHVTGAYTTPPGAWSAAFAPDGDTLATPGYASRGGRPCIQLYDTISGKERSPLLLPDNRAIALAYSPDGRSLAVGETVPNLRFWDIATRQETFWVRLPTVARGLAFTPDGATLAVMTGWAPTLWDVAGQRERTRLHGHKALVYAMAMSPDGRALATGSLDGTVKLWDIASGRERAAFDWGLGKIYSLAFAPDGMRIAAGGHSGIVVWDNDES
jgi:WD40 repeat protein